jgi:DNA-binding NtrC family response regulator
MAGIALLVTGPTGTGKELVARAVGLSGYVPFDPARRRFLHRPESGYTALTLSSVSASLLESELFGHAKGAFTGATHDREGYLDRCGPGGTLFLDEIGDLPAEVQVKLLRLVQFRTYHRVGDAEDRTFPGKIVVATWRDLHALAKAGAFRDDLYYRLRGNRIVTPSLHQILAACPSDRRALVHHIALDVAGPAEADALTEEVEAWVSQNLPTYPWPGNVRELEQCVKSVMVFGDYQPDDVPAEISEDPVFDKDAREGNLSLDALGDRYITFVRSRSPSNLEAARRLVLNPRTVRSRVDQALLARLNKKKR